ncbi:T9SS type A sorting domain-containing protein, partial [candidate division KSB1 bacterium]|nr:T9SS type A sorting domain-containing protein [candidate division KSB1 bacterium]
MTYTWIYTGPVPVEYVISFRTIDNSTGLHSDWVITEKIKYDIISSVEEVDLTVIPNQFVLEQNYPNPFNPTTEISFGIPEAGEVKLAIYNLSGQLVRTLVSGQLPAGNYKVTWKATDDK